jgi:thiamine-phosphate pyrophosphorylase
VVNDHPSVAQEVGAPLCHLGQEDFFESGWDRVADLRNSLPPITTNTHSMEIGLSSHSQKQARRAVDAGAAYIAIGPVFATPTKPGRPAVSTDLVRWAASCVEIPWFAIGGINEASIQQILEAGARRVAVVSGILGAENVQKTCRRYRQLIESVG